MIYVADGNCNKENAEDRDMSIAYISSGLFRSEDKWIHSCRMIDSYEIIYVLKGTAYIMEEDDRFELNRGDVLILEPNKLHKGYKVSEKGVWFYWMHFKTSDFQHMGLDFKVLNINDTTQNDEVSVLLSQLLHVTNSEQFATYTADTITATLISYLAVAYKGSLDKSNRLVNEIAEWIRINSHLSLSVSTVSEFFKYNPDYLSLIFRRNISIGLKQYINLQRMNLAKNLLCTSQYSIKEIAGIMNFNDANGFIKYFKYHEKISPLKYKNRYFNVHYNNK